LLSEIRSSRQTTTPIKQGPAENLESFRFKIQNSTRSISINLKSLHWDAIPEYVFSDQFASLIFNAQRPVIFAFSNAMNLESLFNISNKLLDTLGTPTYHLYGVVGEE